MSQISSLVAVVGYRYIWVKYCFVTLSLPVISVKRPFKAFTTLGSSFVGADDTKLTGLLFF